MKTIEEQIGGRCIHFNGIMNEACKCGVNYKNTFGERPVLRMPCVKDRMPHLKEEVIACDKMQFPTPEEIKDKVEKGNAHLLKTLAAISAAKKHHKEAKTSKATIKCPNGEHELTYVVAPSNGHFWLACNECEISMME